MNNESMLSPLDIAKYNIELARDSLAAFSGENLNELTKAAIAVGQAHIALMMLHTTNEQQEEQPELQQEKQQEE